MRLPLSNVMGLPLAREKSLHSGAQCSATNSSCSMRVLSSWRPCSEKKSWPKWRSYGGWTSTCPRMATAWLSGARGPENLSPNLGGFHARLGHSRDCSWSLSLCCKTLRWTGIPLLRVNHCTTFQTSVAIMLHGQWGPPEGPCYRSSSAAG